MNKILICDDEQDIVESLKDKPNTNELVGLLQGHSPNKSVDDPSYYKGDRYIVENNPKIIGGYSDLTALNIAIHKKTGLVTFHSSMLAAPETIYSKNSMLNLYENGVIEYKFDTYFSNVAFHLCKTDSIQNHFTFYGLSLENAKKMPITYDADSPKLTQDLLREFRHYSQINHKNRTKETISLRVEKSTKNKLLLLGKGYTGVINRLIEYAFNNPTILKKCL